MVDVQNVKNLENAVVEVKDLGATAEGSARRRYASTDNVVEFHTAKPIDPAPSAEFIPVEITYFVKESGLLTKRISLAADGTTVIDSSECRMSRGTMERVFLSDWRQLATGLGNLPANTAICLGRLKASLPEKVNLTTKDAPDCFRPGFAARTGDNIIYAPGD